MTAGGFGAFRLTLYMESGKINMYMFLRSGCKTALACADFVLSRAGSNALCEFQALKKPMLLVPYPKGASRGDQILNAES